MNGAAGLRRRLLAYATSLPEAYEDHPWGESVVKVKGKVFVFLGMEPPSRWPTSVSVKLPQSHPLALAQPGVAPTGYGLGRAGWVTVDLEAADVPFELLREWVDESYRAVAPKRLTSAMARPASPEDPGP